ncbi:MAG: hypothetical protein KJO64_01790 [Bacteroidia bacterium]|nr:hypothetical protein [Bacteroidia bacterium]NNC85524.1 hypothetical protein [Bacteroidia bacterium]
METKEKLSALHSEHNEWQNKIKFYRDELKEFNTQLTGLVSKTAPNDVLVSVEHFQNQFIRQNEVLDIMRHDFKQHENKIEALQENGQSNGVDINALHAEEKERLEHFEKLFQELRNEFHLFLNNVPVS